MSTEKIKIYRNKYYLKNKSAYNKASKEWALKNKDKHAAHMRKSGLKRMYGITPDQYNILFELQSGKCKICGKHQSELRHRLCVDHDHDNSKIRGLLCMKCNLMIGFINKDISIFNKAIEYLTINS